MAAFATVEQYRLDSGDTETSDDRIEAVLGQQSAKLVALAGGADWFDAAQQRWSDLKKENVLTLARALVTDAARKMLVSATMDGFGDMDGVSQGSFTANGFQASYTLSNPSGSAYFDQATLKAFLKAIGRSQRMGTVCPCYGGHR